MNIKYSLCAIGLLVGQIANTEPSGAVVPFVQPAVIMESRMNPFEVPLLSSEKIAAQQQRIAKSLQLHGYIRLVSQIGGTAACVYVMYRTMVSFFGSNRPAVVVPTVPSVSAPISHEESKMLREALSKANPSWFTFQWWKNTTSYFVNSIACTAALSGLMSLTGRYAHEDTLEWFVKDSTKLKELTDELHAYHNKTLIKGVRDLTTQDLYFHRVTLAGMARSLVASAEAIVGFMEYRLAYFKNKQVILLPDEFLQPMRVVATLNAYVESLHKMLPVPATDSLEQVKAVCALLLQSATELQQMANRFQGIEYSIQWRLINGV